MKRYEFLFEDGTRASVSIEAAEGRHKDMMKEIEGVKAAITSIIRGRTIKSYEVIKV